MVTDWALSVSLCSMAPPTTDEFVKRLAGLGKDYGLELPKGAGSNVDAMAKGLYSQHGAEGLGTVKAAGGMTNSLLKVTSLSRALIHFRVLFRVG
jgi:ribonuclease HIII